MTELSFDNLESYHKSPSDASILDAINSDLFKNSEILRVLLDHLDLAIWTSTHTQKKPFFLNNAIERISGYPLKAFEEDDTLFERLVYPEDRELVEAERAKLVAGGVINIDYRIRKEGGEVSWVSEQIIATPDFKSPAVSLVGIVQGVADQSRNKQLNQKLIQVQQLEGLATLAGGVAHEFNNVLAIILGHASLLSEEIYTSKEAKHRLEIIRAASKRGSDLVKHLLAFARQTDVNLVSLKINDVLSDLCRFLGGTFPKHIKIAAHLEENLPCILADAHQLHQALLNICLNSRDAMPNGGCLHITSKLVTKNDILNEFPAAFPRDYALVEIRDTGSGMKQEVRERIFDPFFTTKGIGQGTGLGLAVVFGVIEKHHGFIDVRSDSGAETIFGIYLPAVESPETVVPIIKPSQSCLPTILVIEDEPLLRELSKTLLEKQGYRVLTATDGLEGLEMHKAHANEIALTLADLGLPKLPGKEVAKKILLETPNARILVISGLIDGPDRHVLKNLGVKNFLAKPYTLEQLLTKVKESLA